MGLPGDCDALARRGGGHRGLPPGQLGRVAERLLPPERRHDGDQAQVKLAVPPAAGGYPIPFQRGTEPADGRLFGLGQPGPVERQVPAQVPAGRAGTTSSPDGTRKAPTSRITIVSTAPSPLPATSIATTVWSMQLGQSSMTPACQIRYGRCTWSPVTRMIQSDAGLSCLTK